MTRDTLDTTLPQNERTSGKVWCEPALARFEGNERTASSFFIAPDAGAGLFRH